MTSFNRCALGAALAVGFLGAALASQEPTQKAPAKPATVAPSPVTAEQKAAAAAKGEAAAQDAPKSTQDVLNPLSELQAELARTRTELEATLRLAKAGGLTKTVQPYFSDRKLETRSVQVKIKEEPAVIDNTPPAPTTTARLMTTDDKASFGEDVVAAIDGEPIHKSEVDEMVAYYKQSGQTGTDDDLARVALRAIFIQHGAHAAFKDHAAEKKAKIDEIRKMLADGADFAETAKKMSQCPSAAQGGDLGTFGRGMMDPMFEKTAFTLKLGQVSDVIQSGFGYHIIKATGYEKGKEAAGDQVRASHILVMFDDDQSVVRNRMNQLMQGRSTMLFRDDDWMKRNPFANRR